VVPRWTYTRTKLETADRAKENLKPTAFSSTRRQQSAQGCPSKCDLGKAEKPAAAGKFNSAGIRPPLHQPTTQG